MRGQMVLDRRTPLEGKLKGRSLQETPVLAEELGGEVAALTAGGGHIGRAVAGLASTEAPGADGNGD